MNLEQSFSNGLSLPVELWTSVYNYR